VVSDSYRVVCVEKDKHIDAVGTSASGGSTADRRWTLAEVRQEIKGGARFYTVSPSSGDEADVELFEDTIRTDPDEVTDNNLDDLRACVWK
jgi:Protein of unknown function (DUF3892)